eukprot:EG_transcript_53763
MSALEQLKQFTTVVADTANFSLIEKYSPQDTTTNPSLLYAVVQMAEYASLVDEALGQRPSPGGRLPEATREDERVIKAGAKSQAATCTATWSPPWAAAVDERKRCAEADYGLK